MSNIKEIIWDFDGVILLSDDVRIYGFRKIFEEHSSENIEKIIEFHENNGGLSRYVKIKYFYEEILNKTITVDEVNRLAEKFSLIMKSALIDKQLLNSEWLELMKSIDQKYIHSIASGSDEKELNYLCNELGIAQYFKVIKGSPIAKKDLVKNILKRSRYNKTNFILIGDAINDKEAAESNDIKFIGYRNNYLKNNAKLYVDNLTEVLNLLN